MSSTTTLLWLALVCGSIQYVTGNICRGEKCDVDFKTIGCYNDQPHRALPNYIYNERDPSSNNYGNRSIEWSNWNEYFPGFVCRCARKAKHLGYDVFGVQYYGECWAGHSEHHNYAKYGEDNTGCVEDDYQPCQKNTRFCVGKQWHNMVYQIVDNSCPLVAFEKIGCFKDNHIVSARPLPEYLTNDRDPRIATYSGQRIDWRNWDVYIPDFVCRCALKAKEKNYTFFGMQFYGECWSGDRTLAYMYDRDGSSTRCINQCFKPCEKYNNFCSGKNSANYVYKIKDGSCEVEIKAVGCFKEVKGHLAMGEIFHNEGAPDQPNYDGKMLPFSKEYKTHFPEFLCRCARVAKQNGWEYFGVRDMG